MTRGGMGPWLADIAANVLAITMLVLIALGRLSQSAPPVADDELLIPRQTASIGGAEAVELLRQRLLPGSVGLVDVTADPGPVPERVTALFVLDPAAYPQIVAGLPASGADWQELTVPLALKTPDNRWDPGFLALAELAPDPDRFRTALQELLVRNAGSRAASDDVAALSGSQAELRFARWFRAALDVLGFLALGGALWGLARLHRWTIRA